MDERELIEQITREVIMRLQSAGVTLPLRKPSVTPLVILAGRFSAANAMYEIFTALENSPQEFRIFSDESEFPLAEFPAKLVSQVVRAVQESELEQLLCTSSSILLPWIPLPVLSRLVHLQPECPVSLLLTKALLKGIPVRMRKILSEPQVNLYEHQKLSPMIRRMQRFITEGRQLGIEWMTGPALADLLRVDLRMERPGQTKLLTAAEIQQMQEAGVVTVPQGTIITPLAKDELRKHGLRLQMDEGRGVVK